MNDACVFCDGSGFEGAVIRSDDLVTSFVSRPWFRAGHCLVIPNRHAVTADDLKPEESAAVMAEMGRLAKALDEGYGTGIMQKYQPLQPENGIKINHIHFHVFPRKEHEPGLFPVPEPNSFDAFIMPSEAAVNRLIRRLQ